MKPNPQFTPNVRRAYRWKPDDLAAKARAASKVLATLTELVLADLIRRGDETNESDGYPSGGGDGSGVRSADTTTSTERAALRGLPDYAEDEDGELVNTGPDDWSRRQRDRDVIQEALDALFSSIVEMAGHAAIIEKKKVVVLNAGDKVNRINGLTYCQACHRVVECTTVDPIRSGYCSACRVAFARWKASFDVDDMATARRTFEDQREKFEGHHQASCEQCAYLDELTKPAHAV